MRIARRRLTRLLLAAPLLGVLSAATLLASCGGDSKDKEPVRVRLATTTSARDTGLLDWLMPEVEKRENLKVQVTAVGTGAALKLAQDGNADFVIVHDRPREDAFLKDGWGIDRRDLMWNDFVIVGPASDPAAIKGMTDAVAAMQKIGAAKAAFFSRGDDSGTHSRERSFWTKAGGKPAWNGYKETGQGQGPTLLAANEKQAYTLSDRGTFASMRKKLELLILVQGDLAMRNPYGIMLVNPAKNPSVNATAARKVIEYALSADGQARIAAFKVDGEQIFHPGAPPK